VQLHDVPRSRVIQDGDVIAIDVSCFKNGYHGDNCRTFVAGTPDDNTKLLLEGKHCDPPGAHFPRVCDRDVRRRAVTKACLDSSVRMCGPGVEVRAIGDNIESVVASYNAKHKKNYGIVAEFMGHGIGQVFHTLPLVQHVRNGSPWVLRPGMTLTIEPIIVDGNPEVDHR
jgi:methionyl aminopeptidase